MSYTSILQSKYLEKSKSNEVEVSGQNRNHFHRQLKSKFYFFKKNKFHQSNSVLIPYSRCEKIMEVCVPNYRQQIAESAAQL